MLFNSIDKINKRTNIYVIGKSKEDEQYFYSKGVINLISLEEKLIPINFGFDNHWNINGRLNAINSIVRQLKIVKSDTDSCVQYSKE